MMNKRMKSVKMGRMVHACIREEFWGLSGIFGAFIILVAYYYLRAGGLEERKGYLDCRFGFQATR